MSQTEGETGARCAVCKKNKFQLRNRKSRLTGQFMFVCNTCFENKYEPRWLIILTAQQSGLAAVKPYLEKRMYPGDTIEGVELLD